MKNIQVIDGAENCTYDIVEATEDEFNLIFPDGTDVEFIGDFVARVGEQIADTTIAPLWSRRVNKKLVCGIHGTLFYELDYKKKYYPTKKDDEMSNPSVART